MTKPCVKLQRHEAKAELQYFVLAGTAIGLRFGVVQRFFVLRQRVDLPWLRLWEGLHDDQM